MNEYHWLNIPKGLAGIKTFSNEFLLAFPFANEYEKLKQVNEWNRQGKGIWQYWID